MAAFSSFAAAEARAKAKGPAGDRTWVEAHPAKTITGAWCVRVIRYMTKAGASNDPTQGSWVELLDDAAV
jgi:hypothetical protein